jgi:hypothetical protein
LKFFPSDFTAQDRILSAAWDSLTRHYTGVCTILSSTFFQKSMAQQQKYFSIFFCIANSTISSSDCAYWNVGEWRTFNEVV